MSIDDKANIDHIGNMAQDLYENVTATFHDIQSSSIEWIDHRGDKLIMSISKVFD